ncbi:hypothetical protein F53441_7486 [Fusarium austroafricanum]|uniref:Xylanolytic transcriptional activator regulatory domain-containing protein n=1 Tax=Fusarium austroafricanum TaxID=2364996 RepID=A0A8H4KHC9_9HYPO|nr:hypothetical protein F53441_7486 [Fusarium austroafricanum]
MQQVLLTTRCPTEARSNAYIKLSEPQSSVNQSVQGMCRWPYPLFKRVALQTMPREKFGMHLSKFNNQAQELVEAAPAAEVDNTGIQYSNGISWAINEPGSFTVSPTARAWPSTTDPTTIAPPSIGPGFQINNLGNFSDALDPTTGAQSINWLSDSQFAPLWESQLSIVPEGLGSMTFTFPSELVESNSPYWSSSQPPGVTESHIEGQALELDQRQSSVASKRPGDRRTSSIHGSSTSRSTDGALYVDGTAARAPFRGRLLLQRAGLQSSDSVENVDLFDTHGSTHEASNSPGENGSQDSGCAYVTDALYSELASAALCEVETHSLGLSDDLIPPMGHVRCFVRLYYENFHPIYPFLQKSPSVWQDPNNWILLLAVSTIGARYLEGPWVSSMAKLLEIILNQRLASMTEGNDKDRDDIWVPGSTRSRSRLSLVTVQAAILNLILGIHSGQKATIESALAQRLFLVEECRKMGLLSHTPPHVDRMPIQNSDVAIRAWTQAQSEMRTGMMIWILDSIIAYEFDCPHILQLHEIKAILPCQEDIWDQPTLEKITSRNYHQVTVLEALHLLYMEKRQPPNLTEFGNIILIYAVCRRTKEAAYQSETALSRWTPVAHIESRTESSSVIESWPPSLQILTRWRNSACDVFDILHWKANGKAANAGGSEHPTILHLHLSRLYILAPTKYLQRVAAAAVLLKGSNGVQSNFEYSEACNHLYRWANIDQYKARLSIIHAGALLWHVRRYSSKGFVEPHAIYLATLSIWAYSVFATRRPEPQRQQDDATPSSMPTFEGRISQESIENEEQDGEEEPEPEFIHLDRPCDDEMVQVYIRLGHKMAGYMQRVGNICSSDSPPKILKEGIRMISLTKFKERGWGIEASFVKSLTSLLHATTAQGHEGVTGTCVF